MSAPVPDPSGKPAKPTTIALVRKATRPEEAAPEKSQSVGAPSAQTTTPTAATAKSGPLAPSTAALDNQVPNGTTTIVPRGLAPGDRIVHAITRPAVSVPVVIVSLALLAASLLLRLPGIPILVKARPAPMPTPVNGLKAGPEDVAALRVQLARTVGQIITDRERLPRLVATLEQQARSAGFVTDVTTRTPFAPVPGVPEFLCHPVALRLENNYEKDDPAFVRFLAWLQTTSTLGVKVEVDVLSLQSLGDGMTVAMVELHFLSWPQANAKTAAE